VTASRPLHNTAHARQSSAAAAATGWPLPPVRQPGSGREWPDGMPVAAAYSSKRQQQYSSSSDSRTQHAAGSVPPSVPAQTGAAAAAGHPRVQQSEVFSRQGDAAAALLLLLPLLLHHTAQVAERGVHLLNCAAQLSPWCCTSRLCADTGEGLAGAGQRLRLHRPACPGPWECTRSRHAAEAAAAAN
jgi:hypothetical protein